MTIEPYADDVPLAGPKAPPITNATELIVYFATVLHRFGNTRITFRSLKWGASALWQRDDAQYINEAIERLRANEGASVAILCDNPEAETVDSQTCIEVCDEWTEWEERRFYGKTLRAAFESAEEAKPK